MPDENDILELPPVPSPYREKALELLTEMLVDVEEGRIYSFDAVVLMADGRTMLYTPGAQDVFHSAGALLWMAARRLDFIESTDIEIDD